MKESRERAPQGAVELSDDMLDLVSGGADQVDERKQRLLDMMARYETAQGGGGNSQADSGSAGQEAVQNAMLQGLMNSQL